MRYVGFLAAALLAGCNTVAVAPTQLSATPAGIEIEAVCPENGEEPQCRQKVADISQVHCSHYGRVAQFSKSWPKERGLSGIRWWFVYNCVT